MIRNYNGDVNRSVLRDLKKLCNVTAENRQKLLEKLEKNGKVSFYTNLNPFFDGPDEMSDVVTLKNEAEVEEYLKADFEERLGNYLHYRNPAKDYLLDATIEYIKENGGNYPDKDKMTELEFEAEAKRKDEQVSTKSQPLSAKELLLKEILELTEDILEARRETKPEDICKHVEPYDDELHITTDDKFEAVLMWDRHEGCGDSSDYRLKVWMQNDSLVREIFFSYRCAGNACVRATDDCSNNVEIKRIMDRIITVHRGMINIAKQEGLEVTSEVDYGKLSA